MTNQDLINFLKKYILFILTLCLFGGAVSLLFYSKTPTAYEAVQTIFVKRQASGESKSFYTYDGYYSAQAAERFTDSALGALKSRDYLKQIITSIEAPGTSAEVIEKEAREVRIKRLSPQLISLSYSNSDQQKASELIESLAQSFSNNLLDLNRGGDEGISISFLSLHPIVTVHKTNLFLFGVIGLFLGAFSSLFISAFHFYLTNLPK